MSRAVTSLSKELGDGWGRERLLPSRVRFTSRPDGGIGRRTGLKILCPVMGRAGSSPAPAINECGEARGPCQEAGGMELAAGRWGRRVDCWELSLGPEAAESLVRDRGQWAEVVA